MTPAEAREANRLLNMLGTIDAEIATLRETTFMRVDFTGDNREYLMFSETRPNKSSVWNHEGAAVYHAVFGVYELRRANIVFSLSEIGVTVPENEKK